MQRKLTAILSADVVGYSGLMERDEAGTMERLKLNRSRIFDPQVAIHGGRQFKLMGDGALVEFASVIAAVNCALAIQEATEKAGTDDANAKPLRYRVGINLGEVIVEGDDIYGDGVNVAARIQTLAPTGGVALSRVVHDQVKGKLPCEFDDMGEHRVKNIETPVHVFSVRAAGRSEPEGHKVEAPRKLSICVLPFANMSDDPQQEYFSDGISEDIITDLSKVSALAVISRNSAFQYKGKHVDLPKVARELKVSHVVEGSVRKAGGRVRVTAQLIDGLTNDHVWAERYDRELKDIFALQDEISEAIVKALKLKLLPEEKKAIEVRGTESVEAYNLYLMARQLYSSGQLMKDSGTDSVVRLCRGAIKLDAQYARAWALMALAQAIHSNSRLTNNGLEAAEHAIALDSSLAEARVAKGRVLLNNADLDGARAELDLALRLDPELLEANINAGMVSLSQDRYDDAVRFLEKAVRLTDTNVVPHRFLLAAYKEIGNREGELRSAKHLLDRAQAILEREPDNVAAMSFAAISLATLGEAERAMDSVNRALLLDPDSVILRWNLARACVLLGELDRAVDLLAPAFDKAASIHREIANKGFAPLRDHPRFRAMVAATEARLAVEEATKSPPS